MTVRILYLEDDLLDVELIRETLTAEGIDCDIRGVSTPKEYQRALTDTEFDIVFIDYSLPGYDGITALKAAKAASPDRPVILISGAIGEELAIEAVKEGATDYVLKHRLVRLAPAVRRALDESEQRRRRREAERSLSELMKQLRAFMDGAPDAFFIFDGDLRLVEINSRGRELIAGAAGEPPSPGQPLAELFSFFLQSEDALGLRGVLESGRSQLLKRRYCRGGGEGFLELRGFRAGSCLGVIVTETTERHRFIQEREHLIAELESKNAELERFVYAVSHDLKSPLVTIKGFLDLLGEDVTNGKQGDVADDIDRIRRAADTMESLLDDLLRLSRVGRAAKQCEAVDMNALAHEVVELLHPQLFARGIETVITPGWPRVRGDRRRLFELLQNLVENAVRHMGEVASPVIEIGCRRLDGEVAFYVRDNGCGIPPEYHEKVFGMFEQLQPDRGGSGIGLALVRRIVETHEGRVWVESDGRGSGTTFYFTLPVLCEDRTETSPSP